MSTTCHGRVDGYVSAVTRFLEAHPAVANVRYVARAGCGAGDIAAWEARNAPHRLPEDLKAFAMTADGFELTWDAQFGEGDAKPLGKMHVCALADVRPLPLAADAADDAEGPLLAEPSTTDRPVAAFSLDTSCATGRTALVYVQPNPRNPQVWFQDGTATWHVLAKGGFSDYFRLMASHLGLPNWQYGITSVGLDPTAAQWRRYLGPERLAIDLHNGRMRRSKRKTSLGRKPKPSKGKADTASAARAPARVTYSAGTSTAGRAAPAGQLMSDAPPGAGRARIRPTSAPIRRNMG